MKTITYNPETHVLVPREPSQGMIDAMPPVEEIGYWAMYEAAIAAAPQPEPVESEPVGWYDGETGWLGKRKGGEHWQPVFTHQPADNKPVDVDPVAYIDCESPTGVSLAPSAKGLCDGDSLYATPQPDRTAELAALKAENESLRKDASRLDWVEHQDFYDLSFSMLVDQPNDGMTAVSISEGWHLGNNLREAIDAAMIAGEKG